MIYKFISALLEVILLAIECIVRVTFSILFVIKKIYRNNYYKVGGKRKLALNTNKKENIKENQREYNT